MTDRLAGLLELRFSFLLDIDDDGRVLVGNDDSGATQLHELAPDGTRTVLTTSTEPCLGRYLPGSRSVVVSTDDGGTERAQLWLVDADHPESASASPDGRWLALGRLSLLPASSELMLADLDSGKVVPITDVDVPGHWTAPHWLSDGVLVSASDAGEEHLSVLAFDVVTR